MYVFFWFLVAINSMIDKDLLRAGSMELLDQHNNNRKVSVYMCTETIHDTECMCTETIHDTEHIYTVL